MNADRNLITEHWQEDTALERFRMIAPLADESMDQAKRVRLRHEIAAQNGLSYKTITRYDDAYQNGGFEGLKPADPSSRNRRILSGGSFFASKNSLSVRTGSCAVDRIIRG